MEKKFEKLPHSLKQIKAKLSDGAHAIAGTKAAGPVLVQREEEDLLTL